MPWKCKSLITQNILMFFLFYVQMLSISFVLVTFAWYNRNLFIDNMKHFNLRTLLYSLVAFFMLTACDSKPPTPDAMYKQQASGVVLVLNKFYYNASLPNGQHLYFTGIEEDGTLANLTNDVNQIRQNCGYLTGTAFFIDKKGTLLTNRHVVQPMLDKEQVNQIFLNIAAFTKQIYDQQIREVTDQWHALERQRRQYTQPTFWGVEPGTEEQIRQVENEQAQLHQQYDNLQRERSLIDEQFNPSNITIHPICQLGIGYNDSYVTTEADFMGVNNACSVVRCAQDEGTDLAMIQLRCGRTPDDCYVFSVEGAKASGNFLSRLFVKRPTTPNDKLSINQQLYMIGFNAGFVLANTRKGIKVQMTGGRITQLPDGDRLLYSIPAMQGSSGSPVINEWGDLVGVNFAKMNGSDNFNFGIPIQKVRQFVKGGQ